MEGPREAQWAPDPYRRHELRYWDGAQWTEHVSEGDGAILVDPPLPSPRGRRQAHTPAEDVASLAEFVGGSPARTATRAPDRLSVEQAPVVVPTPARGASASPSAAPLPYGVPSRPHGPGPYPTAGSAGQPVRAAGPGPYPAVPAGVPPAASRSRADLFADLPGVAPRRASTGSEPPAGYVTAQAEEGWDWRESRVPEILAGAAVALLVAVAAFLGRGGFSGADAGAVEPVVSGPAAVQPSASAPSATKKPKKKAVPGAQVSSAKPGPIVRRTSSSTTGSSSSRTTTPTRTRTTTAPSSSSTSTTTTDEPPPTDKSASPPAPSDASKPATSSPAA